MHGVRQCVAAQDHENEALLQRENEALRAKVLALEQQDIGSSSSSGGRGELAGAATSRHDAYPI